MAAGKRPTLKQKKIIRAAGKNPNDWLITKAPTGLLYLVHKHTGTEKVIPA